MSAPTLVEVQRHMQRFVLHGEETIANHVAAGVIADKASRLRVYGDAYRLRLVEILGNDFPVLKACTGAPLFDELAAAYLSAHPSQHFSVRYSGNLFASWLSDRAEHAALTELAAFEWMQGEVFDAADSDVVVLGDVAGIAPEDWPALQLQVQSAARWLALRSNAPACVAAHSNAEPLPDAVINDQSATWLLWRRGLDVHWRSLPPDEAAALTAARVGANFGDICESLRPWHEEDAVAMRAASLLKLWICDELIAAISVDA